MLLGEGCTRHVYVKIKVSIIIRLSSPCGMDYAGNQAEISKYFIGHDKNIHRRSEGARPGISKINQLYTQILSLPVACSSFFVLLFGINSGFDHQQQQDWSISEPHLKPPVQSFKCCIYGVRMVFPTTILNVCVSSDGFLDPGLKGLIIQHTHTHSVSNNTSV